MQKFKRMEQNILAALQAMRSGKQGMYDVATWCVELFNESDNYAAEIGISADDVVEHIESRFLVDFNLELSELIVLLKVFPDRAQWTKPLRSLIDEAHGQARTSSTTQHGAQRTSRRATLKELEQAEDRAKFAESQTSRLTAQVDQLRKENDELRRENDRLQGRIEQMEKVLRRKEEAFA